MFSIVVSQMLKSIFLFFLIYNIYFTVPCICFEYLSLSGTCEVVNCKEEMKSTKPREQNVQICTRRSNIWDIRSYFVLSSIIGFDVFVLGC